jgi:hypothetical protein
MHSALTAQWTSRDRETDLVFWRDNEIIDTKTTSTMIIGFNDILSTTYTTLGAAIDE